MSARASGDLTFSLLLFPGDEVLGPPRAQRGVEAFGDRRPGEGRRLGQARRELPAPGRVRRGPVLVLNAQADADLHRVLPARASTARLPLATC